MPIVYIWTNYISEDLLIQANRKTAVAHIHCGGLAGSVVAEQCGDMALVERDV